MSTVVVVGASSGLGAACVEVLGKRGYRVIAVSRRGTTPVRTEGDWVRLVPFDVSKAEGHDAIAESLCGAPLDAIVYCAGANCYGSVAELTSVDWDQTFDVNARGAFLTIRALLPSLRAGGRILVVSSTAVLAPFEFGTVYCAAKAALAALASSLRQELKDRSIGVTVLSPGSMPTAFWGGQRPDAECLLPPDFVASLILIALDAPSNVEVSEIVVRPISER